MQGLFQAQLRPKEFYLLWRRKGSQDVAGDVARGHLGYQKDGDGNDKHREEHGQ
jgi:hypothetical protein